MKPKYKSLVPLFIIISIMVMGVFVNVNVICSTTPTVYVDPSIMYALPDQSFTVDIKVADVTYTDPVHTWQVSLTFNPSVLKFINVTEGDFLRKGGRETTGLSYLDEIEEGYALFTWSILGEFWESGSGTLAKVEFQVLETGESAIDITDPQTTLIKMNPPPVPPGGEPQTEICFMV